MERDTQRRVGLPVWQQRHKAVVNNSCAPVTVLCDDPSVPICTGAFARLNRLMGYAPLLCLLMPLRLSMITITQPWNAAENAGKNAQHRTWKQQKSTTLNVSYLESTLGCAANIFE